MWHRSATASIVKFSSPISSISPSPTWRILSFVIPMSFRAARLAIPSSLGSDVVPVPPAPAERLDQRDRVGVAAGLGLGLADQRLPIGLLGVQHRQIADTAQFQ